MNMPQLRPVDLPRLRDDLLGFAASDLAAKLRALDADEGRAAPEPVAASMKHACRALAEADLFYIAEDVAALVQAAAATLPEFTLSQDDPPSRAGLAYFAGGLSDIDEDGANVPVVAIGWSMTRDSVRIATYIDRDRYANMAVFGDGFMERVTGLGFPPVFPIGHWDAPVMLLNGFVNNAGRVILASTKTLWVLMRQGLAESSVVDPGRAAKRRALREGRQPPPVRVIALKRPSGSRGTSGTGVEWHHRWIVRGHWRMARVGVGREQMRPIWISPHVKGPEGAPLLGGQKVYTVAAG